MSYAKILGVMAAFTAIALLAFANTSPASSEFRNGGATYTNNIEAGLKSAAFVIHGEAFSVECKGSTFKGNINKHGWLNDAGGEIFSLTLSSCNYPVTVTSFGRYDVDDHSSGNGDFQLFGTTVTVHGPFGINCIYSASSTQVGTFIESSAGQAKFDWSGLLPRTGHTSLCGLNGELTAEYTVTTPSNGLLISP